ncbi:RidA family protein [Agriterribacter humi]|jgi:enamine deaminase RidA (YjgF/YER057c/UK114 family)|uniref:RidA family protein n=1 Tax=Agriterribacter humi TaxID=1104781 RepID=UPI001264ACDF|nr:RidA family protein [Agriterribacter humi]
MIIQNPFPETDKDRRHIWEMLMKRDIDAFLQEDWSMIANDFITDGFTGVDACFSNNPDEWEFKFPDVELYRTAWLKQARYFKATEWAEDAEACLWRVTTISDIGLSGNTALVRKKFSGDIAKSDGQKTTLNWQSLFYCRKKNGQWKIAGFTGYLPYDAMPAAHPGKITMHVPTHAGQHKTAGPYSPVLIVEGKKLVVISGQAAIDIDGNIKGDSIEAQTIFTLQNCSKALESAGCTLQDVFKVNVYMKDLAQWERFNQIYRKYFLPPLPVRTAVQTGLLPGLLVEIELWAIKN